MPIAFEIDHGAQRVLVTATDEIRIEDMVALVTRLAELRALGYAQRFDARGALVMLTAEETRRLVPLVARLREEHGQSRTAFIADSDVSFGMARMYATLSADTDTGFMVYRTIEEGEEWLGWQRASVEQRTL